MRNSLLVLSISTAACGGAAATAKAPAPPAIDCDAFARSEPQMSRASKADSPGGGRIVGGARVEGDPEIRPSHDEETQMIKSGVRRVFVDVKVCLGTDGLVEGLELLRPSGLPAYDKKLCEHIVTWRYQPFQRDGAPVEACAGVSFNYDIMPAGTP